ncbi:hypothetical protein PWY87_19550 [Kribbella solani]|uniref:hypothetical protein n=1 Tax=Kribbella solani TaxID=236067 RepID=UPI0029B96B74|nr:hypothetical protein [Kribbella solani]MDX3003894.1 hypothetical protein [Kribbella solani]
MSAESEHGRRAPGGIALRARATFDRDGEVAHVSKLTVDESRAAHRWVITRDGHAVQYRDDDPVGKALTEQLRSGPGRDLTGEFAAGLRHISPAGAKRPCDEAKSTTGDQAGRDAIDRWFQKITPALEANWSVELLVADALKVQRTGGRSAGDGRPGSSRPQTARVSGRADRRGPGGRGGS